MNLSFKFTPDEIANISMFFEMSNKAYRKTYLMFSSLLALFCFREVQKAYQIGSNDYFIKILSCYLIIFFIHTYLCYSKEALMKKFKKEALSDIDKGIINLHTRQVKVDDNYFYYNKQYSLIRVKLCDIEKVQTEGNITFVFTKDKSLVFPIPHSAFENEEELTSFLNMLKA